MHDEYAVGGEAVDFTFTVPLGGFLLQQQQYITASAHHRGAAKFLRTQPHRHTHTRLTALCLGKR